MGNNAASRPSKKQTLNYRSANYLKNRIMFTSWYDTIHSIVDIF